MAIVPLTDAEARQRRVAVGSQIMRVTQRGLNVPARALMDGVIWLVDGATRQFENQAANLLELTTEAALRLEQEVEDAEAAGDDAEDFVFTVSLADLTIRKQAFVHAPFAEDRDSPFAEDPRFARPIVGLDVDEEGDALDIAALAAQVRSARREAQPAGTGVPEGFTPATGGAFED